MSTKRGRYGDPRKRQRVWVAVAPTMIAACRPVDASRLPELDIPVPPPMVDDTIKPCERCGEDCWVAPRKLALAAAGRARVMCMVCAVTVAGPGAAAVDLNPDRVERPRR